MILNPDTQNLRSLLLAYIGNTLSAAERNLFDMRLLEDDVFARQVDEEEFALVEEYADNTLPAAERSTIGAWIDGSEERRAQAAIAAALRYSAATSATQRPKYFIRPVWMWLSAAACLALLATLPLLLRKHPQPPVVASLDHAPKVRPQATEEDVVLLEAHRFRGSQPGDSSVAYNLHPGRAVRVQIVVPHGSATMLYSIDLRSTSTSLASAPVRLTDLKTQEAKNVQYVEFSLPPDSLAAGSYACDLHSRDGSYHLHFSITYLK